MNVSGFIVYLSGVSSQVCWIISRSSMCFRPRSDRIRHWGENSVFSFIWVGVTHLGCGGVVRRGVHQKSNLRQRSWAGSTFWKSTARRHTAAASQMIRSSKPSTFSLRLSTTVLKKKCLIKKFLWRFWHSPSVSVLRLCVSVSVLTMC